MCQQLEDDTRRDLQREQKVRGCSGELPSPSRRAPRLSAPNRGHTLTAVVTYIVRHVGDADVEVRQLGLEDVAVNHGQTRLLVTGAAVEGCCRRAHAREPPHTTHIRLCTSAHTLAKSAGCAHGDGMRAGTDTGDVPTWELQLATLQRSTVGFRGRCPRPCVGLGPACKREKVGYGYVRSLDALGEFDDHSRVQLQLDDTLRNLQQLHGHVTRAGTDFQHDVRRSDRGFGNNGRNLAKSATRDGHKVGVRHGTRDDVGGRHTSLQPPGHDRRHRTHTPQRSPLLAACTVTLAVLTSTASRSHMRGATMLVTAMTYHQRVLQEVLALGLVRHQADVPCALFRFLRLPPPRGNMTHK